MSAFLPYVPLAFAIGAVALARKSAHAWVSSAAWLCLAAGFALLTWGDASLAAAVAIASFAAWAVVPVLSVEPARRLRVAAFTGVVPAAVCLVALFCVRDATSVWSDKLVLFAASWAALIGALACFVAALGLNRRPVSMSTPIAMSGAAVAILIAGRGRSSLPEAFYGLSLQSNGEPVRWVLDPTPGFESGMRLAVAAPVSELEAVFAGLALLGVITAGAVWFGKTKFAKYSLGALTLGAVGLLAAFPSVVSGLLMPGSDAYGDEVKRRLLVRGGERVADFGAFTATTDISVSTTDLAPEIFGLLFAALLGAVAFIALSRDSESEPQVDRAFARDFLVRGVAFLWVGWFVLLIVHNSFLGAPGMGSPGEWVFTGICVLSSGLLLCSWDDPQSAFGRAIDELTPGLICAMLLIGAGLAWRFGALPGLSLGIFG